MFNSFDLNIFATILGRFKIEKILVIGLSNISVMNEIFSFSMENNSSLCVIDSEISIEECIEKTGNFKDKTECLIDNIIYFKDNSLNVLPTLKSFDVVFINGDPNWYTIYAELNLIKQANVNFPLIFICNNKYPHKRKDSYYNPQIIPEEYLNNYSKNLSIPYEEGGEIKSVIINDNYYHAVDSNTPKNGVLTAIEDFLAENKSLKLFEINPWEGITLIYDESNSSHIQIENFLNDEIKSEYSFADLSDIIIENNLLLKAIHDMNLPEYSDNIKKFKLEVLEKNNALENYENKIKYYIGQINYKNSQISSIKTKISLNDAKLQNLESKLFNKDNELELKENELQNTKNSLTEINRKYKNQEIIENKYKELVKINQKELINKDTQIKFLGDEVESKNKSLADLQSNFDKQIDKLVYKDTQIKFLGDEVESKNKSLADLQSEFNNQMEELNDKVLIMNRYEEKMQNMDVELEYLKYNTFIKKILAPFAYFVLIFKSNSGEVGINIKLYNVIKKNKCFDVGYYLNKYPDVLKSKWCKYFSPELHYVCNGFAENRDFNKLNYANKNKEDLINNIDNN